MTIKRAFLYAFAAVALLATGVAIGAWHGPRLEAFLPSDRFVADRMAECGLTVRIHERAVAHGDAVLEQLVAGDMVSCGVLVSWYPDKIPERAHGTAERIRAALGQNIASR